MSTALAFSGESNERRQEHLQRQRRRRNNPTGSSLIALYSYYCYAMLVLLLAATSMTPIAVAFSSSSYVGPTTRSTRTSVRTTNIVLFGVRSTIRQRLSRLRPSSNNRNSNNDIINDNKINSSDKSTSSTDATPAEPTSTTTTAAVLVSPPPSSLLFSEDSLYNLPPLPTNRRLTKLEIEFRTLLGEFSQYSERDLQSLRDPRMRALFRGIAAGSTEPAVYRAFEILFEDLYPLRLAGRLVGQKLKDLLAQSKQERQEEIDAIVAQTENLEANEVEEARLAFVSVAAELNGDAFLTVSQLSQSGGTFSSVAHTLGFETVHDLLDRLVMYQQQGNNNNGSNDDEKISNRNNNKNKNSNNNKNEKRANTDNAKLSFTDLVMGLNQCAQDVCAIEECNPAAVMHQVMYELKDNPPSLAHNYVLDERRQRFEARYQEMVHCFIEWEDLFIAPTTAGDSHHDESNSSGTTTSSAGGRRMEVVKGCFVGAKNEPVVNGLGIVYVDYSALRLAGDIIFKLVSSVMNGVKRRRKN